MWHDPDGLIEGAADAAAVAAAGAAEGPAWEAERRAKAVLLHELFGNPFRSLAADPAWLTADVVRLAQAAYDERQMPEGTLDTARLAILADALLDAGSEDAELIAHCRQPGPHVRGCWALDAILVRS